jgi:hypothetical protein
MDQTNQAPENTKKENPFIKQTMTYGLITGIALIIYTLILYMADMLLDQNTILGLINYMILIAGIYIGTKSYRDQNLNGFISYGKSLGTGVLISVFAGIVMGVFTYLLYEVIDPQLLEKSMRLVQEEMLKRGVPESQVETLTEAQRAMRSPIVLMFGSILTYGFMGFIFSLITSIFTKKEEPIFK